MILYKLSIDLLYNICYNNIITRKGFKMIWSEMSYNKYDFQGDLFRIKELWNENDLYEDLEEEE